MKARSNSKTVSAGTSSASSAIPGGSTCEFFFTPVRSDFSAFLHDITSFWWRHHEVQVAVEQDLDAGALKDKRLRQEDRAFELARCAPLFPDADAEALKPFASRLLTGRPRTPALVVFIAAMATGFTGSAYAAASRTLLLESVSLHALLGDLGYKLPADNTLGTLVNRISEGTLSLILLAQLADFLKEGLDTFGELTVDSTAIKASSCWPTDAKLIYGHFERSCRLGAKLSAFGLTPLNVVCKDVLLKEVKNQERNIALLGGGPTRAQRLRHLYDKFYQSACSLANKLIEATLALLLNVEKEILKLKPSLREQAGLLIRQIHQDGVAAITTIHQSMLRVHDGISTKARDKVLSLADTSAAYIEKGGREPVIGYKPQLARSAAGFVTAFLLEEGNGADCLSLLPLVQQSVLNTGVTPPSISTHDGYAGKKLLEAVRALGVERVSISGAKGKALLGEDLWNHPDYLEQRCKRSAIESLMFTLKFNHNFGRPGRRGVAAVRAELMLKILAYNFDHARLVRGRKSAPARLPMAA